MTRREQCATDSCGVAGVLARRVSEVRRRLRAILGVVGVLACVSATISAQQVPTALVRSLLNAPSPGEFQLRVGVAAEGLPPGVIPPDAVVLGSVVMGPSTQTVLAVTLEPAVALDSMRDRVMRLGFALPVPRPTPGDNGFVRSGQVDARQLCRGTSEAIAFAASARPAGGSLVSVQHSLRGAPVCDPNSPTPPGQPVPPRLTSFPGLCMRRLEAHKSPPAQTEVRTVSSRAPPCNRGCPRSTFCGTMAHSFRAVGGHQSTLLRRVRSRLRRTA
jgi:hypothetical protein